MKIRITVKRMACYSDLIEKYENPIKNPCNMKLNQEFILNDLLKPKDMCDSAWETMYPFIKDLFNGKNNFYDGWMKDKNSALISCNDGFRPVSFLIKVI